MQTINTLTQRLVDDKLFWTAVLVGPACWLFLVVFGIQSVTLIGIKEFLLFVVCYPVVEELAFRGCLQTAFYRSNLGQKHWRGFTVANLLTSIVFVAFHVPNHSMLWAIAVFAPSLGFGYFRDHYQSVVPALYLHIFYNFGFYLIKG